jgi:hypothetical protein
VTSSTAIIQPRQGQHRKYPYSVAVHCLLADRKGNTVPNSSSVTSGDCSSEREEKEHQGVLLSTLLHTTVCPLHNLLNLLVQIANKIKNKNKKSYFVVCRLLPSSSPCIAL